MRPNPFLLAPLCLALAAAILLIARSGSAPGLFVSRPATSRIVAVTPAHRPAHPRNRAWRDAGARGATLLDLARRANVRPVIQHNLARLSHWTAGRAGAAREGITMALAPARARASAAAMAMAMARLGARVQDGRRRAGLALGAPLRRAEAGIQDRTRAIARAIGTAPWSR